MSNRKVYVIAGSVAVAAFVVGLLIGLYGPPRQSDQVLLLSKLTRDEDPDVSKKMLDSFNASRIEEHLRKLTVLPHIAGKSEDDDTLSYVRDEWISQGYDVEVVRYDVLLSYPDDGHNNTATILSNNDEVLFTTTAREIPFFPEETHSQAVQPFNAFSPSGTPQAELVYANYARDVDFEELQAQGISVTGKIVIARYGKLFRGNKVQFAAAHGAVGVILYMDPLDFTDGGTTYPDSIWLPPTGVQRGNIVMIKGDQATPGYPAVWYTSRLTEQELNDKLPKIPSHPIGYADAYHLLKEMDGVVAPEGWQGGLNITYKLGGTMLGNKKVKLVVKNHLKTVPIYNIIAKMKGTIESDKVVLLGNHRDAWVYGGNDPSTGTAVMLETSRVYAQQVKNGWKPRRSMIFCSWDAEEYGLVGSYEWVEDNVKWLQNRAVAYLNIDTCLSGNYTLAMSATPTLKQAVYRATKKIPDPHQEGRSMYDVWAERVPDPRNAGFPYVWHPGAGTDFVPFEQEVSIPTTSASYRYVDLGTKIHRSGYPLYHTLYEGFKYSKMIDPEFKVSKAVSAFLLELARDLVDSPILPFDPRDYSASLHNFVTDLFSAQQSTFNRWNVSSVAISSAVTNFTAAANAFHDHIQNVDRQNPIAVRVVNEVLMTLEKAFYIPSGLPDRVEYKHALLSPSRANYYSTTTFPGLADLLYQIGDDAARWEKVRKHLSVLTFTIQSAAKILMVDI